MSLPTPSRFDPGQEEVGQDKHSHNDGGGHGLQPHEDAKTGDQHDKTDSHHNAGDSGESVTGDDEESDAYRHCGNADGRLDHVDTVNGEVRSPRPLFTPCTTVSRATPDAPGNGANGPLSRRLRRSTARSKRTNRPTS
jgi:hypothetical protein